MANSLTVDSHYSLPYLQLTVLVQLQMVAGAPGHNTESAVCPVVGALRGRPEHAVTLHPPVEGTTAGEPTVPLQDVTPYYAVCV